MPRHNPERWSWRGKSHRHAGNGAASARTVRSLKDAQTSVAEGVSTMEQPTKKAAGALILNEDSEVLAISRKDDTENFGIIGGKADRGETPLQAMLRELEEEAAVIALEYDEEPIYVEVDEQGYEMHTFLVHRFKGEPREREHRGAVLAWLPPTRLLTPNCSFRNYNRHLFERVPRLQDTVRVFDGIDQVLVEKLSPIAGVDAIYRSEIRGNGRFVFVHVSVVAREHVVIDREKLFAVEDDLGALCHGVVCDVAVHAHQGQLEETVSRVPNVLYRRPL